MTPSPTASPRPAGPTGQAPAPRLRVLHVHSGNLYGGVETFLVTLARLRHLAPEMESRFALCFEGELARELRAAAAGVAMLGAARLSRPHTAWMARRRFRRLLRESTPGVVVTHSPWAHALFGPVCRAEGVPLVFWLHDYPDGRHYLQRLARRTPPDLAVCNSHFTASALGNLFPATPHEVVYCPREPLGRPSESDRAESRGRLGIPEGSTVIVQIGRLERVKGQDVHLEALGRLRDLPGWICLQVGGAQRPHEKEYLRRLEARAVELGIGDRVRFLGAGQDVARILAAADLYCQPNRGPEGFGLTFVEALSAGVPVVTTAIGGGREVVTEECGRLVPPGDPARLADALRSLLADRETRVRLGARGPERARELCDPASRIDDVSSSLSGVATRCATGTRLG